MTTSALEANINECFINVRDRIYKIEGLDLASYFREWEKIESQPTLNKYKMFLKLKGKKMDLSSKDYQSIEKIKTIRDELIHYKPQWDEEKTAKNKIETIFRGISKEITFSPFIQESSPFFPMRCMTNSFAKWTITSTLNFLELFDKVTGIEHRFDQFRSKLEGD